jgi:hypothetical protein
VLFELAFDAGVRVYVRVEEVKRARAEGHGGGEREARTPGAFRPGQLDARRFDEREAAQNRDARVALLAQIDALLEVEPPLFRLRLNVRGRRRARADEVHAQSFGQSTRDVPPARASRPAVGFL